MVLLVDWDGLAQEGMEHLAESDDNVMPFDDNSTMTVQCNAVCGLDNLMIIIR